MGLVEGATPPPSSNPRHVFGGIEFWGLISSFTLSKDVQVGANVFSGFDGDHPTVYVWTSPSTTQELTLWGVQNASVDDGLPPVVRLPRLRPVQGRALTVVTFDYHAVLGEAAAPTADNRIAGWTLADEHLSKVEVGARPSLAELLARAREVIREADPLRRPVRLGMASETHPSLGAPQYGFGAVNLAWDDSVSTLSPATTGPPAWAELRHGFLAVSGDARQYFGSLEHVDRDDTCLDLTEGTDPSAVVGRKDPVTCKVDYGIALTIPLDSEGTLRFTTSDIQSSWHLVRSVTGERQAANRSYAHHHVRVLREDLELNEQIADVALSPTPWAGLVFFNAPVLNELNFADPGDEPNWVPVPVDPGYFRHDFWAGVHHADGIWAYSLAQLVEDDPNQPTASALNTAVAQGLELIRGTNPAGAGLRNALGNGWRWHLLHPGDPGPPWMAGFVVASQETSDVEFGAGTGRTPEQPQYNDLVVTALRVGLTTWLILTNSVPNPNSLVFQHAGPVEVLTPSSLPPSGAANLTYDASSSQHTVTFTSIDAIVLRLDPR